MASLTACFPFYAQAQAQAQSLEASARHYTEKSFILEGEPQAFHIELSNPTSAEFRVVRAVVSFNKNVDVRGLDKGCSQWKPDNKTQLICTIPLLKAESFLRLSYYIVGDIDLRPGFVASLSVTSLDDSIAVSAQEETSIGLSDDSRFIEGSVFSISVARDILRDSDADGVSDVSENIMGTDPTDTNSVSRRNAIIDVAVLHSMETDEYYSGRFGGRIEQLIAVTNQVYRRNDVGITLRLVAQGRVDYSMSDKPDIDAVFTDFSGGEHAAFPDLESIREGSGADVVVFAHPIFRDTGDSFCGTGLSNTDSIQGDFYREAYGGRMLSVIDVSRDCLSSNSLATVLAFNMGIVTTRSGSPDGGTFSFSSGYVQDGLFATHQPSRTSLSSSLATGTARLSQFSSPQKLCLGQPCGVDRSNLSRGADAVYSLNATSYVIEHLTPAVIPVEGADAEPKTTIDGGNSSDLEVLQYPSAGGVVSGDWISFHVEARNNSSNILNNLEFRFTGSPDAELLRSNDNQCAILTVENSDLSQVGSGFLEGKGDIVCYVSALDPGQTAGFSYEKRIEGPVDISPEQVELQFAFVNNIFMPESLACVSVFADTAEAAIGSNSCSLFTTSEIMKPTLVDTIDDLDLAQLPTLEGSILTVPYVRLYDGTLVSAQFFYNQGPVTSLEIIDAIYLDPELSPSTISKFDAEGMLVIKKADIDGTEVTLVLKYIEGTEPPVFVDIEFAGI